ncbi:hypothetical protein Tco_0890217, partial [Tanacetum coccineum]
LINPLPSEEDDVSFLRDLGHTGVINSVNDIVVDQMHQPWRTFVALINRSLLGKTSGLDKLCLSRAQIIWGMYFQKNVDYVELLWENFTYQIDNKEFKKQEKMKEASQIYGAVLPECLTSPEIKESKAYKTYLGYATGGVPPKVAIKFKKPSPSKKESELAPGDEESVKKGKRLKTPAKKYASKPATSIVIREPPVETKSKRKENVDVAHGKGIELLSEVALFEKAQMKEAGKKSLRDFHKTHPSGSGVPDVTNDDSSESESDSWGNDEDDNNNEQESSDKSSKQENDSDEQEQDEESNDDDQEQEDFDQENESEDDEMKSDEEQGMDDTTDQFDDDADARLEEPTETTGIVQGITALEKEVVDLKKDPLHTQVTSLVDRHLDTRLGETRQEFMNFLSESLTARIKEQVKDQLPQILPQEVSNFAPPVIIKLIKESRDEVNLAKASSQPQSTYEATLTLTEFKLKKILLDKMEKSESYLMAPEHRDCYDGLKKSYALDKDFFYSYDLSKDAEPTTEPKKKDSTSSSSKGTKSQPKSSGDNEDEPRDETASRRDWFKKPTPPQEPTNADWNVGKTTKEGPTQNRLMTLAASTSTDKSLKDIDELMSTSIDFSGYILNGLKIENLTQEILLGPAFRLLKGTRSNYAELEYDFEECYKALSEKLDWENPEGGDYPFDLSKPLPLIKSGKNQRVPFEFFINNDLKYLQGGISTMTYTMSTTKTKAAQYDLPGIEDMVPNICSPVKVTYDKYTLWGISHWREQHKSLYAFARGMQSRGDVYSTKRILAVTHVSVMRKYGYGYLEEIIVRRADNDLYIFKEGDDVVDFAIALRMYTRSLVIQRRVEDLQLGASKAAEGKKEMLREFGELR